jgi:hypothetical protein
MPIKNIKVKKWISTTNFELYDIPIYEDDSIEEGVSKIAFTINNKSRFYVWNTKIPNLLFSIDTIKWKDYNPNPIKLKFPLKKDPIIKDPIIYKLSQGNCEFNFLNIIFENDFPELKDNQYYFIDKDFPSLNDLNKKYKKLNNLDTIDTSPIIENRFNVHRFELSSIISQSLTLADVFTKLNTNKFVQYIQWVNDSFTLLHKLYLFHNISSYNLKKWTSNEKLNDVNCINCYCLLEEENGSFIKFTIFKDLSIKINFIIDLRKNITWDIIEDTKEKLLKPYLQTTFEEKIVFKTISIKVHNYIFVSNVPISTLAKNISLYQEIFKTISFKNTINLIYKRSSNYSTEPFDLNSYVKNRLLFGVDIDELVDELLSFNKTKEEAKAIIAEEIAFLNDLEQQNIKPEIVERKMNTIVIIKTTKFGFEIIIHNIPNKNELDNLIYWLSKIISSSTEKIKEPKKPTKKQIIKEKTPSPSPSDKSTDDEDLGKIDYNTSSSSGNYGGGRLKDNDDQRYRINLLQNADKDLFGENYARGKCQKKSQPFVISPEKREELISNGTYYVDNDIAYGSKKDKLNYYICPRYWCKDSKVPADPKTKKCPIPNEEIIESYFNNPNEEDVKRYVNLKKPNENDLCIPCCFKKPPKEEDLNKCKNYKGYNPEEKLKIAIDEKEKNYLVDKLPVDIGRLGIIPQQLHELLFPETNYKNCSKDINKDDGCLVRKGISHKLPKDPNIDSIMNALAEILDFKSKKQLINDIKNRLNLIMFLSIENGNVCKAFMDKLPIIPNENNIKELHEHLQKYPEINKICDLDNDIKYSRYLAIYKSYKKFIDYLETNSYQIPKSPYYLFSLISILYNKLLIIWEKQTKEKIVNIICPFYTSFSDLISSLKDINPDLVMLIKEKKYYEPLEVKYRNKDLIKTFKLNQFPNLNDLFKACSNSNNFDNYNRIYQNIFSLQTWINSRILKNYEKFKITSIIINSDLTIEHFLTKCGILLTIDKIGISFLEKIISDFKINKIYFYDDLNDNGIKFNINVLVSDLELFKEKAISLKIKYNLGILNPDIKQEEFVNEVYTILEFPKKELTGTRIINTRIEDDLYIYENETLEENKKWFQLQSLVFTNILKVLTEEKLKELHLLSRNDYINELLKIVLKNTNESFNKINLNKIKIIIEEIPIYSIKHIKNYLNKINIYYKYDFLNPIINIDNKRNQYVFSQVAINNGIPIEILNYHKSAPVNDFYISKLKTQEFNFKKGEIIKEVLDNLPSIFNGEFQKLESKWTMHKKSIWYSMEILKVDNYSKKTFIEFFDWFSKFINMNISFDSVLESTYTKLRAIRNDEYNMKTLLSDKIILQLFSKLSGKKYQNVNTFWDNVYSNLSNNERLDLISKIINYGLPLNDILLISVAELLNISIITIHRAFYKTTKDKDIRGNIEDLIVSSTLFKAQTNYLNRPLLIFYKNKNEYDDISYHFVLNKNQPVGSKSLYLKLSEVPQEILRLVDEHIKNKNQ